MSMASFDEVEKIAFQLMPEDRLRLAGALLKSLHSVPIPSQGSRAKWSDALGMVSYPFLGEDAQTWITRGRMESEGENGGLKENTP